MVDIIPTLMLAGRLAGKIGAIGADRVGVGPGASLPDELGLLLDPKVFNRVLAQHHTDALPSSARVRGLERLPIVCPSSNCCNAVFQVEWEEPDPKLPTRIFAKLPGEPTLTRAFCNLVHAWEMECRFCTYVATEMPIRVPTVYAVARAGSRFVLLLEDLGQDPHVSLFDNRDMAEGTSLEVARRCLETLAKFHGHFSGRDADEQEELVPAALHPFRSERGRHLNLALNAAAIEPCRRKAPESFTASLAHSCRSVLEVWDSTCERWYGRPLTLIHGDSHLGNFFVDGPRMGMLDFQAVQWAPGMRDVQYFLINSLDHDLLALHERDLVTHYAEAVSREGAPLPPEDAWEEYRAFSIQTLQTLVVSLGLGGLTEKEEVVRTLLRRAGGAVERLDFAGWLHHDA